MGHNLPPSVHGEDPKSKQRAAGYAHLSQATIALLFPLDFWVMGVVAGKTHNTCFPPAVHLAPSGALNAKHHGGSSQLSTHRHLL